MYENATNGSTQRYQPGECVGRGGLGAVFRAWDLRLERWVAIKRLTIDPGLGAGEIEAKMRGEANALAALQHPNVVTIHDFGTDEDGPFVVMEFIEGQTLDEFVERAPFDYASFIELATQALAGLVAAHRVGLLHRDLKPGNLMLTVSPDGSFQVKVLDFGLAKFAPLPMTQTLDQGDTLLGTIFFMAPEQFGRGALDVRTDLYALGCVFYYALTGCHPFTGDSVAEIMASHLRHEVRDLGPLRPDVPGPVVAWVMRLLSLVPAERPAQAADALAALRAITRTGTTPVPADAPANGVAERRPRKSATLLLVGLGIVTAAIGTAILLPKKATASRAMAASADPAIPAPAVASPRPGTKAGGDRSSATPVEPAAAAKHAAGLPSAALAVDDVPALRARMGQIVDVFGTPVATGRAKTGKVAFLNFSRQVHQGLSIVFFLKASDLSASSERGQVRSVEDLQPFIGKPLIVHGQLSDFKGDVQIVANSLDQLRPAP